MDDPSELYRSFATRFDDCRRSRNTSRTAFFVYHAYRRASHDFDTVRDALKILADQGDARKQAGAKFPKLNYVVKLSKVPGYLVFQRACETPDGLLYNVPPAGNAVMYTEGVLATATATAVVPPPHVSLLFYGDVSAHLTPYGYDPDKRAIRYWKPGPTTLKHVPLTRPSLDELLNHQPSAAAAREFGVSSDFRRLCEKGGAHLSAVAAGDGDGDSGAPVFGRTDPVPIPLSAVDAIAAFARTIEDERVPLSDYDESVHHGIASLSIFIDGGRWLGVIENEASGLNAWISDHGEVEAYGPPLHFRDPVMDPETPADFAQDFHEFMKAFRGRLPVRGERSRQVQRGGARAIAAAALGVRGPLFRAIAVVTFFRAPGISCWERSKENK